MKVGEGKIARNELISRPDQGGASKATQGESLRLEGEWQTQHPEPQGAEKGQRNRESEGRREGPSNTQGPEVKLRKGPPSGQGSTAIREPSSKKGDLGDKVTRPSEAT